jgi:adenosylmethionine-8-amino-7-oxononanoate aminotransferase
MLTSDSQSLALRHLWLHFTPMGDKLTEVPIIVRGEGCYVYDEEGKRYLDGLSCLFCVNVGHGRRELASAAAAQAEELAFYSNWSAAHPRAVELAAKIASLTPGDLNRVFFAASGGDANESAIKLARQYHKLSGSPLKTKIIARREAYHGTSLGALSLTGITAIRVPFEPLLPGVCHVPNAKTYRLPEGHTVAELAEAVRERILFEGPDTVAAVIMEPVQNSGGCIPPPEGYFERVREICDEFNVLLISDEVICAWGRLGYFFGHERYGYAPDMVTTAKGLTSAYAPIGAVIATDRVFEPFRANNYPFLHGNTFGGHPVSTAVALANIEIMEQEELPQRVLDHEDDLRNRLESLYDIPIVGDVRGAGYFYALELVRNQDTKEPFSRRDSARIRTSLQRELMQAGLICRVDDRGGSIVELAPPLIAGPDEFEQIVRILRPALTRIAERMGVD